MALLDPEVKAVCSMEIMKYVPDYMMSHPTRNTKTGENVKWR
jgi:hypothetical protein